ncbi:hypothetical protein SEPCBS119000_002243 [Sporothrix epigloea]|uniref:Homeobox domain-containing protein n=1 Tax=Sporothrix epigloea TaxID=1892477 RepID=A0ABP0DF48_9PEZI
MEYTQVVPNMPQMGMIIGALPRPTDIRRPRQPYPYTYGGEPFYLFSQMPPHHRSMTEAQLALATKHMDPKPRLGKDEVQMLEDEFQKNPKPSSTRKREIADILKVDNPRINNWFQNRRAKAKQMSRQAGEPATHDSVSPYTSSPSEQLDDTTNVSEYFDSQNQSLPLRASSAAFPVADEPPLAVVYTPHDDALVAGQLSSSPSDPSNDACSSPASLVFSSSTSASHELPFPPVMNGAYLANPHNIASYSSHASPQHMSSIGADLVPDVEYDPLMDPYISFAATSDAISAENIMAQPGYFQPELLSTDNIAQLDKNAQGLSAYEGPVFDETVSHGASTAGSPQSAISDLRFKSPPPPANIASRRNKGVPAMLNATALRSQSFGPKTSTEMGGKRADSAPAQAIRRIASATGLVSNRVQKPGAPTAPRSPLYYERTKEALLQSLQHATTVPGGGPPTRSLSHSALPVSPNEALTNGVAMISSSYSDNEQYLAYGNSAVISTGIAATGPHNTYFGANQTMLNTPPGTPGFGLSQGGNEFHQHVVDTQWGFFPQDEALLTPSLGSFGSEEFTMLQAAPCYIASSQPPTPVFQSFAPNYFPVGLQGSGVGGVTGVPAAPGSSDFTFPGESYIFSGSFESISPCLSKNKQFQFTQNVTPEDYNAER